MWIIGFFAKYPKCHFTNSWISHFKKRKICIWFENSWYSIYFQYLTYILWKLIQILYVNCYHDPDNNKSEIHKKLILYRLQFPCSCTALGKRSWLSSIKYTKTRYFINCIQLYFVSLTCAGFFVYIFCSPRFTNLAKFTLRSM
jgi:hypothetical protein